MPGWGDACARLARRRRGDERDHRDHAGPRGGGVGRGDRARDRHSGDGDRARQIPRRSAAARPLVRGLPQILQSGRRPQLARRQPARHRAFGSLPCPRPGRRRPAERRIRRLDVLGLGPAPGHRPRGDCARSVFCALRVLGARRRGPGPHAPHRRSRGARAPGRRLRHRGRSGDRERAWRTDRRVIGRRGAAHRWLRRDRPPGAHRSAGLVPACGGTRARRGADHRERHRERPTRWIRGEGERRHTLYHRLGARRSGRVRRIGLRSRGPRIRALGAVRTGPRPGASRPHRGTARLQAAGAGGR